MIIFPGKVTPVLKFLKYASYEEVILNLDAP